jgi:hypothetical protein
MSNTSYKLYTDLNTDIDDQLGRGIHVRSKCLHSMPSQIHTVFVLFTSSFESHKKLETVTWHFGLVLKQFNVSRLIELVELLNLPCHKLSPSSCLGKYHVLHAPSATHTLHHVLPSFHRIRP